MDDRNASDESGIYLPCRVCGQGGRGHRVNGVISPGRGMSLEATSGTNPVCHVGKLYNVLAMHIARDIHAEVDEIAEVDVQLETITQEILHGKTALY